MPHRPDRRGRVVSGKGQQRPRKGERITPKQCLRIRAACDQESPRIARSTIARRFGVSADYVTCCGKRRCKHQEGIDGQAK